MCIIVLCCVIFCYNFVYVVFICCIICFMLFAQILCLYVFSMFIMCCANVVCSMSILFVFVVCFVSLIGCLMFEMFLSKKNQKVWSLSNVVCLIHMYDAFMLLSQCFILCLNRFLYVYMCLDCCLHAYNVCMSVCHFLMRLSCLSQCL